MKRCGRLYNHFLWNQPFHLKTHAGVAPLHCQRKSQRAPICVGHAKMWLLAAPEEGAGKSQHVRLEKGT